MHLLRTYWLPVAVAVAVLLKLLLCAFMPLDVHANAAYDDAWAVRAADFLSQGQWLGPYDDITLIKNIGFPLWLAFCHKLGISYLFATALLYALASGAFVLAIRPLVQRDWLLLALFIIILFCPVSFATDTFQRIYRNSITAAQVLFVFAAYLGCYVRVYDELYTGDMRVRSLAPWVLIGAFALPWFWLSREDSIWIAPFVAVATIVLLGMLGKAMWDSKKSAPPLQVTTAIACAVLLCVPLATTLVGIHAVKAQNESHYGVATTAEINSGNFARVVKSLNAIDPAQVEDVEDASGGMPSNQRVAVTHAALIRAYGASSVLSGISKEVEEQFKWGDTIDNNPGDGEVNGGEFFWVIRRGARDAGVYGTDDEMRQKLARSMLVAMYGSSQGGSTAQWLSLPPAQFADAFYGCIADELEAALASGRLPKRATMPSSIMTPWRAEYAGQLIPAAIEIVGEAFGYGDVSVQPFAAQGTDEGIAYFESVAHGKAYRSSDPVPIACVVGEAIAWLYCIAGTFFALAGIVSFIVLLVRWLLSMIRREGIGLGALILVLVALLFSVLALVAGLSYSRVSSFVPINYYYYGSAAYPLLLAFNGLAISGMIVSRKIKG